MVSLGDMVVAHTNPTISPRVFLHCCWNCGILIVLAQVFARLGDEYRAAGNMRLFDRLQKSLMDEPDRPSQADTAHEFGMTENAVKQAFHRLRQRYRQLLREEIAHTVMVPGDIDDELRHLIAVLRA